MLDKNVNIVVCLLNYNAYKDTIECVESLFEQKGVRFSIVIVDNCSTNNSVLEIEKYLRTKSTQYFKMIWEEREKNELDSSAQVYLIQSPENKGFSAGNNIAIRFCQESLFPDYILLLNNDTVVPADFLSTLSSEYIRLQKSEKKKIALGAREINYYSKKQVHSGFQYMNLLSGLSFNYPIIPFFKYICGACIMLDKNAPLLDEGYFLYFDDTEYAKILKNNGYKISKTGKTHYFHKLSATTSSLSTTTTIYFRSMWRFYQRNYPKFIPFLLFIRYILNLLSGRSKNEIMVNEYASKTK